MDNRRRPKKALPEFVSSGQAAERLGAKRVTVSQMCQRGALPAVKVGNRWLIPLRELEKFAKSYVPRRGRPRQRRTKT